MQARFQHTRWPLSEQFRQSSGIQERIFFTVCRLFFLYLKVNQARADPHAPSITNQLLYTGTVQIVRSIQ